MPSKKSIVSKVESQVTSWKHFGKESVFIIWKELLHKKDSDE